jgi:hypothetical protein
LRFTRLTNGFSKKVENLKAAYRLRQKKRAGLLGRAAKPQETGLKHELYNLGRMT